MKFVSWNVNGLRACMNKGFLDTFYDLNADFFCLQETKLQEGQISLDLPGYQQYWCYAEKKGYSGTAIFTKHTPLSVSYGLGVPELDTEGRLITLEYPEFFLVTCYTPNAQRGLARIEHRLRWEEAQRSYLKQLDSKKPVILCGDLNVAHKEIDLKNPSSNRGNAGFSDEERGAFTELLDSGFTDTFRHLYPNKTGAYSWWSYMFNARQNNAGWRIDYFVVSDRLKDSIYDASIHPDVMGSDHCPVGLDLNITCNGGIWSPESTRPETKDTKEADEESPAGHICKFFPLALAFAIGLMLLIPALFLIQNGGKNPTETQPSAAQTDPENETVSPLDSIILVSEIIDRTGTIEVIMDTDDVTISSYVPLYLTDGEETWELTNGIYLLINRSTFHLQLVFDPAFSFTRQNKPEITGINNGFIDVYYYYGEDRNIAGCFISGYVEKVTTLELTVTYNGIISNPCVVTAIPDLSGLTTEELVDAIEASGKIEAASLSSQHDAFDSLIQSDLCIQELSSRTDAIAVLLDVYKGGHQSSLFGIHRLLEYEPFISLMTNAEKAEYEAIKHSKGDTVLFG